MNKEIAHHIEESKKLLEQGRFTIQEHNEQLDFLMSDLWLVMERFDSINKILAKGSMISWAYLLQMQDDDGNVFITEDVKDSITKLLEKESS